MSADVVTLPDLRKLRAMYFPADGAPEVIDSFEEIERRVAGDGFLWIDLAQPLPADLARVGGIFNLHPLALEDATLAHERPKIEIYDEYRLVLAHAVALRVGALDVSEMAIFAGERFALTIRTAPLFDVTELERRWIARSTVTHDGSGFLYVALDTIVDTYHPVALHYEQKLGAIEAGLFDTQGPPERTERAILRLRRELSTLRRSLAPMREMLAPLVYGELRPIAPALAAYYRDVFDHVVREIENVDAMRELISSALDVHFSSIALRQTEISNRLTVIATIFLPLTWITGFFGMNFDYLVGHLLIGPQVFWYLGVGSQVLSAVLIYAYFRAKRWA